MEDDLSICRSIKEHLQNDSTDVCCLVFATEALECFIKEDYCLVIMDWQLPETDSIEILRIMRETKHTPVLVLTQPLQSNEKVKLFQAGANAFIEKPVDMSVCAAQAATLMELYLDSERDHKSWYPLTFGTELIIHPLYRQAIIDSRPIDLTRTEFDLLFCLAQRPGQVWSRSQLYHQVWDDALGSTGDNIVRTHIGNLRKKLTDAGKNYIQTTRGIGYRFVPPDMKK